MQKSDKIKIIHYGKGCANIIARLNKIFEEIARDIIVVENFESSKEHTEAEQIQMLSRGEICFTHFGSMFPMMWVPDYDLGGIPFLFSSIEDVEGYWNSWCGQKAKLLIQERGNSRIIGMNRRSPRQLTSNFPIMEPEDLIGFRLRIPEIDAWKTVWDAFGTQCIQMPQGYVLGHLKSGELDGQENSLQVIKDFRLYEAQKYLSCTNHIYGHIFWAMNEDFYNNLDRTVRELFEEALMRLTAQLNTELDLSTRLLEKELERYGCSLVNVNGAEFALAAQKGIRFALRRMAPEVRAYMYKYIGKMPL